MRSGLRARIAAQANEIASLKAEIAECRHQIRAVIAHNPHAAWVYSLESLRFLAVNDLALGFYGWSRDEFLHMTIADIRPREDVPALLANVARMRDRPCGISGPWRHCRKDGAVSEVVVSYLSLPFFGQPARLIVAESLAARRAAGEPAGVGRLSPREREVLGLVARGHTSHAIGEQLGLSPKSVDTYRARFMMKLGLKRRADIVDYAVAHGLLAS
jgi:PAS domain S-box-containing protein